MYSRKCSYVSSEINDTGFIVSWILRYNPVLIYIKILISIYVFVIFFIKVFYALKVPLFFLALVFIFNHFIML